MSLFDRIPKPMKGMNWEPTPSDYTSLPAPQKYGDTDFANDDFVALWNQDNTGVGRHDLKTLQDMGVNTIKMYNWSVPAPKGYWMRNHRNFLAMCQQLGIKVIVPISNFFTGTAYNNRTNGGNPAGPPASSDLKSWIEQIVTDPLQIREQSRGRRRANNQCCLSHIEHKFQNFQTTSTSQDLSPYTKE